MGAEHSKYDSLSVTTHYADTRLPYIDAAHVHAAADILRLEVRDDLLSCNNFTLHPYSESNAHDPPPLIEATVRCAFDWEAYIELPSGGPRLCKLEAVRQSGSRFVVFAGPKIVDRTDPGPVLKIKGHWGGTSTTIRLVIESTKGLPTMVATGHVQEPGGMYLFMGEQAPDKRRPLEADKIELMAKVYSGGNKMIARIAPGMDVLAVAVAWALMGMIRANAQ